MKNHYVLKLTIFLFVFTVFSVSQISAQANASCFTPGTLVVTDATGDALLTYDIQSVSVAEPFYGDNSQKLVFTLKVQNLITLPAASWNVVYVGPDNVVRFVQMSTLLGSPEFKYGTITSLLGVPIFNYSGNIQGTFGSNGTVNFYIDKNLAGNFSTGQTIAVSARTYIKPVVDLVEVDNAGPANYTLVGNSGCTPYKFANWGKNGDVPVTNDYFRNGTNDFAVWRPDTGIWFADDSVTSESKSLQFGSGTSGDIPVPGDYDNDGKGDFAVFRPSAGTWYIYKTETGSYDVVPFGSDGDIPLSGDFDGDRVDDIAVFRPSTATWYIRNSSDSSVRTVAFGASEDRPLVGDFDGDRKADLAVFRPSNATWYISQSADNSFRAIQFGIGTDTAVPADYDGDGKADVAIWRPESGVWYVLRSSDNSTIGVQWGVSSDRVQPGDFNGNGRTDFAVWRPETGIWYVYYN